MTCIVGLINKETGITYMGCDSCASNGYFKNIRTDKKIFKLKDTSSGIIGFTTSYRMGQLLMYSNELIDKRDEPNIDHEYVVTKFIPKIIDLFEKGGFNKNNCGEKEGGNFLLAYKDKLWQIECDYQVSESKDNYMSVGSGEAYALGSVNSTENMNMSPIERIHLALQSASKYAVGVEAPFYIMNTNNDEVIEYKKQTLINNINTI